MAMFTDFTKSPNQKKKTSPKFPSIQYLEDLGMGLLRLYRIFPCMILCAGTLYNRKVLIIPVDFTDGQQVYEDISKQLADLDIGILGMSL